VLGTATAATSSSTASTAEYKDASILCACKDLAKSVKKNGKKVKKTQKNTFKTHTNSKQQQRHLKQRITQQRPADVIIKKQRPRREEDVHIYIKYRQLIMAALAFSSAAHGAGMGPIKHTTYVPAVPACCCCLCLFVCCLLGAVLGAPFSMEKEEV
jgi:hypothetical protein